jgi:hypothetical protein
MSHAQKSEPETSACEVIDFGEALIDACPPDEREELMTEADILAQAFAGGRGGEALEEMAEALSTGSRDAEMDRAHARKLAAALRRLARDAR